jgi:hypothetical protein
MVSAYVFWASYAAWVMLFIWTAWRGRLRVMLILGTIMVLIFTIFCAFYIKATADSIGSTVLIVFAAAILIAPLLIAAIAYPIGRLWSR